MAWKQRVIKHIIENFCKESDSVEAKRRQCILVGTTIICIILWGLTFIHAAFMGTLIRTHINWPTFISFFVVLGHCKYTRGCGSARLLYLMLIAYNVVLLSQRNGFMYMSHLAMLGLIGPVLSLFITTSALERSLWFLVYLLGNATVHILQVQGKLPPTAAPDQYLTWINAISTLYTGHP